MEWRITAKESDVDFQCPHTVALLSLPAARLPRRVRGRIRDPCRRIGGCAASEEPSAQQEDAHAEEPWEDQ